MSSWVRRREGREEEGKGGRGEGKLREEEGRRGEEKGEERKRGEGGERGGLRGEEGRKEREEGKVGGGGKRRKGREEEGARKRGEEGREGGSKARREVGRKESREEGRWGGREMGRKRGREKGSFDIKSFAIKELTFGPFAHLTLYPVFLVPHILPTLSQLQVHGIISKKIQDRHINKDFERFVHIHIPTLTSVVTPLTSIAGLNFRNDILPVGTSPSQTT